MNNSLNILLNGKIVQGIPGETILELAKRYGYRIPTLCNDPRLEPYSSCFVCVVEVEGLRWLQPACSTRIYEGMKINTESDRVRKARKTALDLLVSNHYADCVAPCKETCPAGVDVQGYISLIEKRLYSEAVALIKQTNPLPAICGRVCVRPCEAACRRNLLDEGHGVGIDYLKRFAADRDLESAQRYVPEVAPSTGKKIAIIGAGPGGLSSAYFLQQKGHQCDIYEAGPKAGGWLRYGIPEYRLPNDIVDKEVHAITELGTRIFYNRKLGDNLSYQELKDRYDAVILTIGSQRGTLLGCEGEDAENVFSGIDFLRNMEMTGQRYNFSGKTVAVVGGGNTAMDCRRTSVRCGADKVYVIYRRTEAEMPANPIEIHESKPEGVEYLFLTNPKQANKDENGAVKSITCLKMDLGAPDSSGRRRPIPVEGSEFELEVDYILAAIGQKTQVDFLEDINIGANGKELKLNRWGDIDCDRDTLQTGIPSVFAAGDGVSGPATIIEAIAQAKVASRSCHQYLMGEPIVPVTKEFISRKDNFREQEPSGYTG
ncbi:MAG: FAD-dependent oxidoreductase, partial [Bacteroidota bacterium]